MIPKAPKHKRIKAGRIIDKEYLEFCASFPCCVCSYWEVQAHHRLKTKSRQQYGKSHDTESVPLCFKHHSEVHDKDGDEYKFMKRHNVDFAAVNDNLLQLYREQQGGE